MTKKETTTKTALELMPLMSQSTYGLALSAGTAVTQTEQRIFTELHRQQAVIDAQAAKTIYAAHKTTEIRTHGSDEFQKLMQHLSSVNEAARGKDYQAYVEEFNHHNAQGAAHELYRLIETGAAQVREQVGTSLDLRELPAPKPTRLQRLLGG